MRLFTCESLFDIKSGKWEDRHWIDGILVDGDLYFFELEREKELEAKKLLKQCEFEDEEDFDPCEGCQCRCCEAEGFTYDDLLDIFVGRILETEGCSGCIKDVLDEFADIFIGDDEDLN